ncbi:hypothetical protein BaRGS_00024598 [Batillaria attramentaria]|uniref:Uncharacterized protein n=1 Tax=Batillaria attramentaria TaxID=370345 RepID=A0ABD0KAL3_9CAEN
MYLEVQTLSLSMLTAMAKDSETFKRLNGFPASARSNALQNQIGERGAVQKVGDHYPRKETKKPLKHKRHLTKALRVREEGCRQVSLNTKYCAKSTPYAARGNIHQSVISDFFLQNSVDNPCKSTRHMERSNCWNRSNDFKQLFLSRRV